MHKKRIIIILLLVYIFSVGHTNNYKVVIDDKINEEIDFEISNNDINKPSNLIDKIIEEDQYIYLNNENKLKYDKTIEREEDITKVKLKHKYEIKDFERAKYFNVCFEKNVFINKKNYLYIRGYDGFYCSGADAFYISVTTNKLVTLHNADKVNGNTYTWIVNLKKYKNFTLEFQVALTKNNRKIEKKIISPTKLFFGIIIVISSVLLIVIIEKYKKESI